MDPFDEIVEAFQVVKVVGVCQIVKAEAAYQVDPIVVGQEE